MDEAVTPTDAEDEVPGEEQPDETAEGLTIDDRPDEPTFEPVPPED